MKVAVTTMRDAAGADVAKELLGEHGSEAEIRRLVMNAYFGAPTAEEFEVRVPADRVDEAHEVLRAMAEELERAAVAEANVPPGADEPSSTELPPPELRPRKPSFAIALGLVGPVPGCGVLYARAFALGWTMVAASVALFVAAVVANRADWLVLVAAAKALDVVLAPILAARFNRTLQEEKHAAVA